LFPAEAGIQRCQVSLAGRLSAPRRRGPITTKVSICRCPATSPCCGVWVPACAGTTEEGHCFPLCFRGDGRWATHFVAISSPETNHGSDPHAFYSAPHVRRPFFVIRH